MPRYIDADKVEKWSWQEPRYSDSINDRTDLRDLLRSLPTISPSELRDAVCGVGRPVKIFNDPWTGKMYTTCSRCDGKISPKDCYCKHCGARMKGAYA